jgi:carbon monoxide dehydrogenase subunit G
MNEDAGGTRGWSPSVDHGQVAQFGRGVLDDVSAKLLRQFVENLEARRPGELGVLRWPT